MTFTWIKRDSVRGSSMDEWVLKNALGQGVIYMRRFKQTKTDYSGFQMMKVGAPVGSPLLATFWPLRKGWERCQKLSIQDEGHFAGGLKEAQAYGLKLTENMT